MHYVYRQLAFWSWSFKFTKCTIKFAQTSDLYYNQLRNWERKERKRKTEADQNWKRRAIYIKHPATINVKI